MPTLSMYAFTHRCARLVKRGEQFDVVILDPPTSSVGTKKKVCGEVCLESTLRTTLTRYIPPRAYIPHAAIFLSMRVPF